MDEITCKKPCKADQRQEKDFSAMIFFCKKGIYCYRKQDEMGIGITPGIQKREEKKQLSNDELRELLMKKFGRFLHLKNIYNFNSIIKTILIHYWKIRI